MPKSNNYLLGKQDYERDVKEFGYKLRAVRESNSLSLDDLSSKTGIDKSALSKMENGARAPRFDTFLRIIDALEIYPIELMPGRFSLENGMWVQVENIICDCRKRNGMRLVSMCSRCIVDY